MPKLNTNIVLGIILEKSLNLKKGQLSIRRHEDVVWSKR